MLVLLGLCVPHARGEVVIVANRTRHEVRFTVASPPGTPQPYAVKAGTLAALPVSGATELVYAAGKEQRRCQLSPNCIYYFSDLASGLDLQEIGLGDGENNTAAPIQPAASEREKKPGPHVLTVKILVDKKERAVRALWEKRVRERIGSASRILDHHCHVQLKVIAVEEWQSDDAVDNLGALLRDFEIKVKTKPADLTIGFTSQKLSTEGQKPVGVTRRALHDHILIREWWPPRESGRLEVLLHEIGHYLGAVHSADHESVMRASIDKISKERVNPYPVFDPVNTLAMNLVAEEVFERGVKRFADLRPATKQRLRVIYTESGRALPDDPTPGMYLRLLDAAPAENRQPVSAVPPRQP
jgi:Matrixin